MSECLAELSRTAASAHTWSHRERPAIADGTGSVCDLAHRAQSPAGAHANPRRSKRRSTQVELQATGCAARYHRSEPVCLRRRDTGSLFQPSSAGFPVARRRHTASLLPLQKEPDRSKCLAGFSSSMFLTCGGWMPDWLGSAKVKHQSLAGKTGLHLSSLRYGSRKQAHSPQICFACAKHRQAFNVKEEIWLWFPKSRKIAERQFLKDRNEPHF